MLFVNNQVHSLLDSHTVHITTYLHLQIGNTCTRIMCAFCSVTEIFSQRSCELVFTYLVASSLSASEELASCLCLVCVEAKTILTPSNSIRALSIRKLRGRRTMADDLRGKALTGTVDTIDKHSTAISGK